MIILQGDIRLGKKHGQGTYRYADGRTKRGTWKDDKYLCRNDLVM
jgi:hypothetical protein